MDNNTQIEAAEEYAKKLIRIDINDHLEDSNEYLRKLWINGANWQKQQDEAKYKENPANYLLTNALRSLNEEQLNSLTLSLIERSKYKKLLESHNELLGRLELINPILLKYADAINGDCCLPNTAFEMITKSNYIKLEVQVNENLINKAKNIKK